MITINRKEGETVQKMMGRFSKLVKQVGLSKAVRDRMFFSGEKSELERRRSAIHRAALKNLVDFRRKLGYKIDNIRIKVKRRVEIKQM